MKVREIKREMRKRGWELVRISGDHFIYHHPEHEEVITLAPFSQDRDPRGGARWRNLLRRLDRLATRKSQPT